MSTSKITWRPATADDVGRLCRYKECPDDESNHYQYGLLSHSYTFDNGQCVLRCNNAVAHRCEVQDVDGRCCQCAGELQLRRKLMARYPFCPDHRDKVSGKPCRECENEHMRSLLKASHHLLMGSIGPSDGPTSWIETRARLLDRMRPFVNDGGEE